MTEHDPLCPSRGQTFNAVCLYCALIAKVRADERDQVAEMAIRAGRAGAAKAAAEYKADLRDKVDGLPSYLSAGGWVKREDVLALIDGTPSDQRQQ